MLSAPVFTFFNMKKFTFALILCVAASLQARDLPQNCTLPEQAMALAKTADEKAAVKFMYDYMTFPDMADYSPEYHVRQVRWALRARHEMPWGKTVPQREWRHFVLPVRVNNENLDNFRDSIYDELKARVEKLSMREAVLEINHWCHEYVTYKPSDARTSSPLASMRTATGRCGEESTYTVSALRAMGIPARQVYTPRWAHTDDNHAWVEAWVDGTWYFLGACEPEAVLDLGWFNQPASRGMLMHTKVFGDYNGPEDVISRTPHYTEINVTDKYAKTARTYVETEPNVNVEFKIYNYGEFYTVFRTTSDAQGKTSIQSGLGDMLVWCSDNSGRYGFQKFTAGKDTNVKVELNHRQGDVFEMDLTVVPPVGGNNLPYVSPEDAARNEARKAYEDSIRTAYTATFPKVSGTSDKDILVKKSFGNYKTLYRFLEKYGEVGQKVLTTMSDKDIRDFDFDVLDAQMQGLDNQRVISDSVYRYYVASPRVATEMLSAWRTPLSKSFTKRQVLDFQKNPSKLATWINKNVTFDEHIYPNGIWLSPVSSLKYSYADERSKGLLFVAVARSLNIPARIDEVTEQVQYLADNQWVTVAMKEKKEEKNQPQATLGLDYTPQQYMENPNYYTHFSLCHFENGRPLVQNYGEEDTWATHFKDGREMQAGDYLLSSGTRMANGSVLVHLKTFTLNAGAKQRETLIMLHDSTDVQVIGNFNAENLYNDGTTHSILSHTGRGYYVTGLIRANNEPTNHILHDLEKMRGELEAWGRPILLCFRTAEELERFNRNRAEFTNLPSTLTFGVDSEGQMAADLFGSGIVKTQELPIVIIADTFNRIVFASQGYTIGIGDRIKQTVGKLK